MKKSIMVVSVLSVLLFGVVANGHAGFHNIFGTTVDGVDIANHSNQWLSGDVWDPSFFGFTNTTNPYSGFYIGTLQVNNDSQSLLENVISKYLGETFVAEAYFKVDQPAVVSGSLHVTYDTSARLTGTWSLDSPYELGFYAVKAGQETALYYVDPSQSSGIWTTQHLVNPGGNQPGISHLSAMPSAVPEPTTLLLLGVGLVGLAGARRFRK